MEDLQFLRIFKPACRPVSLLSSCLHKKLRLDWQVNMRPGTGPTGLHAAILLAFLDANEEMDILVAMQVASTEWSQSHEIQVKKAMSHCLQNIHRRTNVYMIASDLDLFHAILTSRS